ncbi:MAG: hypothetical protein EHM61_15540 [Acidobacteria bacterium]|nr:MAG: hypothetical protein EHM61_15540 [Acidobacteriota bacterium]
MNPKQYSLFVAIALVAGLASGAVGTWIFKPRAVTAQEFRLVDTAGKTRAVLATISPWSTAAAPTDHVGLTLYDTAGRVRVQVAWEERKSEDGKTIGMAAIDLRNRSGISLGSVQLTEHQYFANSTLTVTDGAGKVTWVHPAGVHLSGPGASLSMGQPQKEPNLLLSLEGKENRPHVTLVSRPQDKTAISPLVEIRDEAGKATWTAP